jgi:hypothetical protein
MSQRRSPGSQMEMIGDETKQRNTEPDVTIELTLTSDF